jgi:gliding motility-associated-like protein
VHVSVAQNPLANPNGYSLKDYAELVNAGILLDDSLWLQDVNLSVVYEPQHGTWTTNPNQTLNYLPERTFVGQDSLLYEVCLKACPEMCDRAWVQFVINPMIVIPDLITPNGDGVNDAFEMIGLENYPHNQLMIYNRWGNEVYLTDDYQNDWAGTYNGQPVPDGTYFWVLLDTGDGTEIMRGYLTVHR